MTLPPLQHAFHPQPHPRGRSEREATEKSWELVTLENQRLGCVLFTEDEVAGVALLDEPRSPKATAAHEAPSGLRCRRPARGHEAEHLAVRLLLVEPIRPHIERQRNGSGRIQCERRERPPRPGREVKAIAKELRRVSGLQSTEGCLHEGVRPLRRTLRRT